jgi:streptogramin lyase
VLRPRIVFKGPHLRPNGLAAGPDGLWICDLDNNRVYAVRYDDGSVITSFPSPARKMSGIGRSPTAVWVSHNQFPSSLFEFDPATGQCLTFLALSNPEGGAHGVEWDDGSLWVSRPGLRALHRIDPATAEVRQQIAFPGQRAHGIFVDGDRVACDDTGLRRLFIFDKRSGALVQEVAIEEIEPHGMTRTPDGRLWFTDDRQNAIAVAERRGTT